MAVARGLGSRPANPAAFATYRAPFLALYGPFGIVPVAKPMVTQNGCVTMRAPLMTANLIGRRQDSYDFPRFH